MKTRQLYTFLFMVGLTLLAVFAPNAAQPSAAQGPQPKQSVTPPVPPTPVVTSPSKKVQPLQSSSNLSVVVPATAQWVNTYVSVNAGEDLAITATGSWTPGPPETTMVGPDGSSRQSADNFLNLQDIGVCATCAVTPTSHWAALIGYIGSAPPAPGSYTSRSILPEAQKVFVVGSHYSGKTAWAGTLWLNFNDDAYSGYTSDNRGQVTAVVNPPAPPDAISPNNWTMVLSLRPTLIWQFYPDAASYRIRIFHAKTDGTRDEGREILPPKVVSGVCDVAVRNCKFKLDKELTDLPSLTSRDSIAKAGYFWFVEALGSDGGLIASGAQGTFQIPPLGLWSEDCLVRFSRNDCQSIRANNPDWNRYDDLIYKWAEQRDLPPAVMKALIATETGGLGINPLPNQLSAPRAYLYEVGWDYGSFAIPCRANQGLCQNPDIRSYQAGTLPAVDGNGNRLYPRGVISVTNKTWNSNSPPTMAEVGADYINRSTTNKPFYPGYDMTRQYALAELTQQDPDVRYRVADPQPNAAGNRQRRFYDELVNWFTTRSPFRNVPSAQYRIMASYGLGQVIYWGHLSDLRRADNTVRPPENLYDPNLNLEVATKILGDARCYYYRDTTLYGRLNPYLGAQSVPTLPNFAVSLEEYRNWGRPVTFASDVPQSWYLEPHHGAYQDLYRQFNEWIRPLGKYNGKYRSIVNAEEYVKTLRPYFVMTQPRNLVASIIQTPTVQVEVSPPQMFRAEILDANGNIVIRDPEARPCPLPPGQQSSVSAGSLNSSSVDEVEIARTLVDLRGDGKPVLAKLSWLGKPGRDSESPGVIRIYADEQGKNLIWQRYTRDSVLPSASLITTENPGAKIRLLEVNWFVGAHGALTYLIRWDGSTYRLIPFYDEGGTESDGMASDGGVYHLGDGSLEAVDRGQNPLKEISIRKYMFDGKGYRPAK